MKSDETELITSDAVVIVDGYSSGALFAPELKKRGYGKSQREKPIIHIQSAEIIPDAWQSSFILNDYNINIVHTSLSETIEILKKYDITAVIVGAETGVSLADQLSEVLNLRTNGTTLSEARRNKYLMSETIRDAGIPAVHQAKVTTVVGALQFQESYNQWPIVIKPLESAGTDGVSICYSQEDIPIAFKRIIGKKNALGLINNEVLIQEFLKGDEYILNIVGRDGKFVVTDIWHYIKKELTHEDGIFRVYDRVEIVLYKEKISQQLKEYGSAVLKTLNIINGPSHIEIMMTKRGPILVEVGARVMGAKLTSLVSAATNGQSQIELTVDSYLFPEKFFDEVSEPSVFYKYPHVIVLISHGGVLKPGFIDALKRLPSYYHHVLNIKEGGNLPITRDLFSSPGVVELLHEDSNQVMEDSDKVDEIIKEYFLEIE